MRRIAGLIAAASIAGGVACGNIWGFQSVTLGDAGADATTEGPEGSSGEGGSSPDAGDDGSCGPGNCSGCCAAGTCVDTQTVTSCGKNGIACQSCGSQQCEDGVCGSPDCGDTTSSVDNCGKCGVPCATGVPNLVATCIMGGCSYACDAGSLCNFACVPFGTSDNCTGCGDVCDSDAGMVCGAVDGGSRACTSCPPSAPTICNGKCVDPSSTADNCGGCGSPDGGAHVCKTTDPNGQPACVNSTCTVGCNTGYTLCNGACIELDTAANCGLCGFACSAEAGTPVCAAGDGGMPTCVSSCPANQTLCGGACVDKRTDPSNCGNCGNACTTNVANASPICTGSNCTFTCNSPTSLCNGSCIDTSADPNNCGTCQHKCTGGTPVCSNGSCVSGCTAPDSLVCSGTCVDPTTDPNNCNGCGIMCAGGVANAEPACVSSTCTFKCNAGYTACNGACVNEQTDRNNCGGCGSTHACAAGLSCVTGSCKCVASGCPGCGLDSPCCKSTTACGCELLGLSCN